MWGVLIMIYTRHNAGNWRLACSLTRVWIWANHSGPIGGSLNGFCNVGNKVGGSCGFSMLYLY